MDVVVIDVLAQHRLQVATPEDQHPVKYFARHGTDPSLGESVALGARTGVLSTSTLAAENTASNMAVNLVSRSRTRNRNRSARSPSSMSRLPACWVTHSPVGWAVTPSTWTWRVA